MLNKVVCIVYIISILFDLINGGGEKFVIG